MKVKINKKIEKMENKKTRKIYRQGDVLLYEVFDDEVVYDYFSKKNERFMAISEEIKTKEYVVREGETGNKHVLLAEKDFLILDGRDLLNHEDLKIIKLFSDAILNHEEHNQLSIVQGMYVILFEREYDYFRDEWRRIED